MIYIFFFPCLSFCHSIFAHSILCWSIHLPPLTSPFQLLPSLPLSVFILSFKSAPSSSSFLSKSSSSAKKAGTALWRDNEQLQPLNLPHAHDRPDECLMSVSTWISYKWSSWVSIVSSSTLLECRIFTSCPVWSAAWLSFTPTTFLSLRKAKGIRIRNTTITVIGCCALRGWDNRYVADYLFLTISFPCVLAFLSLQLLCSVFWFVQGHGRGVGAERTN